MQHLAVKIVIREDLNYSTNSAKHSRSKDNIFCQLVVSMRQRNFLGWKSVQSVYHNFADLLPESPVFSSNLGHEKLKIKWMGYKDAATQHILVNNVLKVQHSNSKNSLSIRKYKFVIFRLREV